jgi:hypothetical protein
MYRSQQLIKATKKGDVAEVEFLLLMMGANVNVTTSAGKTPLMLYVCPPSFFPSFFLLLTMSILHQPASSAAAVWGRGAKQGGIQE